MVEEVSVEGSALAAGAAVVVAAEAGGEGAEPGAAKPRTRRYRIHHFLHQPQSQKDTSRLIKFDLILS